MIDLGRAEPPAGGKPRAQSEPSAVDSSGAENMEAIRGPPARSK